MCANRVHRNTPSNPNETEDLESILRDLERIIYETLSPAQAEAYVVRLRHILRELGLEIAPQAGRP
jgi:hypothetical protein